MSYLRRPFPPHSQDGITKKNVKSFRKKMKKKQFRKKQILGILKSYHAKKRQMERLVTDTQLTEILQYGEIDLSNPDTFVITYKGYRVYLSHDEETILTVTAPDSSVKRPKTITSEEGNRLKKILEIEENKEEEKELTFEEYMKKM